MALFEHLVWRMKDGCCKAKTMSSVVSSSSSLILILLLLCFSSSVVLASIPQSFQHTNLLRTVDLTKPYIRESTALILENTSNTTQTEYYWGIPLDIAPELSYLEVKEKKTGATELFPIERVVEGHSYLPPTSRTNS
jgi:hypothetical protein